MSNPNPEIYGAPETWQTCKYFPWTGGSYAALKILKPKVPNFDGEGDGSLNAGDEAGKTVLNIPIDKSLCPCGQDNTVSCFGDISAFQNQRESDSNKVPTIYEPEGDVSNWFLYDGKATQEQFTNQGMTNGRNTTDNKYQLWSPDAIRGTTSNPNMNLKINPFVDWGIKSMLLMIKVQCITGTNSHDEPTTAWRTLDDWYNNYDQQPICGVSFTIRGLSSATASTITYRNTNGANNNFCGVGLLDKIDNRCDYYRFNPRAYTASVCEFIPFQYLKGNYYANANIQVFMLGIHRFAGMTIEAHTWVNTQTGWSVWVDIPCLEYNYNMIMKMAACFGLPFTPKDKYSFPTDYIDDDLYLPIIDKNGITHGEYTHGADNANNDYLDLNSIRDKNYNPYGYNIYSGDNQVKKIYFGDTEINAAYIGDQKL